ncbi:MAG TPA: DMT family transporter [Azospirillaceae bacterium]|nr:DMT family transporter [Azospirillaceae bacterium]
MNHALSPSRRSPAAGVAFMSASVFLFSLMSVCIKALADHVPVAEAVFFRNAVGMLPVLVAVYWSGGLENLRTERLAGHFGRAVVGLSAMSLLFWSFALLPLADATAINYTAPLFLTALSAPLLGEKVGIYRWSAVLAGFAGMLVMLRPGDGVLETGALVALAAAFLQALAMVAVSQLSRTESSTTIVFYFTAITTVLAALPLPWLWVTPQSAVDWGLLVSIGLIGGCAQLCLTRAYAHAQAAVIAPFTYASLLWATLFGYLFWGDTPDAHMLMGAAIVAASGVFIIFREARRKSPAAAGKVAEEK